MRTLACLSALFLLFACTATAEDLKKGDSGDYKFYMSGNEIGKCTYNVTESNEERIKIEGLFVGKSPRGEIDVKLETVLTPDGKLKSYQLLGTMPCRSTNEIEEHNTQVSFCGNTAAVKVLVGERTQEQNIDAMTDNCTVFDVYNIAFFVLMVKDLSPEDTPVEGKILIPVAFQVMDYSIESAGTAQRNVGGKAFECNLYNLKIMGGVIEFPLYVSSGKLIAVGGENAEIRVELVVE